MITHRELDGRWAECVQPDTCGLLFHFPGQTPDELAQMPEGIFSDLANIIDPPHETDHMLEIEVWVEYQDGRGSEPHRDYDLPALLELRTGTRYWYQYGKYHREGDKPAIIESNGSLYWYRHGIRHRDNGPATHRADGWDEYWTDGVQMKLEPWRSF